MIYSLEAVNAAHASVVPIPERPTFGLIWRLTQQISDGLKTLEHPDYPDQGYAGYMMTAPAFALLSARAWAEPLDVGEFFIVPAHAITKTAQRSEEHLWRFSKDQRGNFKNVRSGVKSMFERCINTAFHTGGTGAGTGLAQRGFGTMTPPEILTHLKSLYGIPTFSEMESNLN